MDNKVNSPFNNERRDRYYGLRIGDTVDVRNSRLGLGVVVKYGFTDNNRVYLDFENEKGVPWVAEHCTIVTKVEERINSKLTDAAPDLLEACKVALIMYREIQPVGGWQFVEDSLVSAIAKATD